MLKFFSPFKNFLKKSMSSLHVPLFFVFVFVLADLQRQDRNNNNKKEKKGSFQLTYIQIEKSLKRKYHVKLHTYTQALLRTISWINWLI